MVTPQFIILPADGHLCCFHLGVIIVEIFMYVDVQVFAWLYIFIILGEVGVEFLGYM